MNRFKYYDINLSSYCGFYWFSAEIGLFPLFNPLLTLVLNQIDVKNYIYFIQTPTNTKTFNIDHNQPLLTDNRRLIQPTTNVTRHQQAPPVTMHCPNSHNKAKIVHKFSESHKQPLNFSELAKLTMNWTQWLMLAK